MPSISGSNSTLGLDNPLADPLISLVPIANSSFLTGIVLARGCGTGHTGLDGQAAQADLQSGYGAVKFAISCHGQLMAGG